MNSMFLGVLDMGPHGSAVAQVLQATFFAHLSVNSLVSDLTPRHSDEGSAFRKGLSDAASCERASAVCAGLALGLNGGYTKTLKF